MAHEVETMAWSGEMPWHSLGRKVPDTLTAYEMLEAAGLDWEVEKRKAVVRTNGPDIDTGWDALIRTSDNTCLSMVGKGWKPVQNAVAFEFFTEFLVAGEMKMNTAGSLREGQIVWGLAKMTDSIVLTGGDKVDGYLLFTNPHQYGKCIDIRFTPVRVVCNNTLTMALRNQKATSVRYNHTRKFDSNEAKMTLGLANKRLREFGEAANFLIQKQYDKDMIARYFGDVFGQTEKAGIKTLSPRARKAIDLVETSPGANINPGSIWNMFNAVTFMTDHQLGYKDDTRVESIWYGANQKLKIKAYQKALELARAA